MTTVYYKGIRRELRKKVPLVQGVRGHTTVPDGHEEAEIEVTVDLAAIARELGVKAMSNKSGCSKYLNGLVVVKVVQRKRVP